MAPSWTCPTLLVPAGSGIGYGAALIVLAGDPARPETFHAFLVARHHPGGGSCAWPVRSSRRGLGRMYCWPARHQAELEKLAGQTPWSEVNPSRMALLTVTTRGDRPVLRAGPCAAISATARRAASRSSTGCSPTRPGARSAVLVFAGNTAYPVAFTES